VRRRRAAQAAQASKEPDPALEQTSSDIGADDEGIPERRTHPSSANRGTQTIRRSTAQRWPCNWATASIETAALDAIHRAQWERVRDKRAVRLMTSVDHVARHLCVILAADVAGYSRLMGRDEEGTLAQLVAARRRMDRLVAAHHGRIVNSVGDSVLAEFSSVIDAIQSAIAIQRELAAAVASTASDQRVLFRIGLQLGEVIVKGTDIYGDGVNVAARLQTLADPGGIVVSGAVFDQLRDRLPIAFTNLGEQAVKNIERPVPAFGLSADAIAALPPDASGELAPNRGRIFRRYGVIALVVLVVGGATWLALHSDAIRDRLTTAAPQPSALGPSRQSIAVLPLVSMTDPAKDDYFADGLTEDIIAALGRFTDISVRSRNAVFSYKGRSPRPEEVGLPLAHVLSRCVFDDAIALARSSDRGRLALAA